MKNLLSLIDSKKIKILALCLTFGIIFLLLSEYSSNEKKDINTDRFDAEIYTKQLEERLSSILQGREGVDHVKVMISLDGTEEYCYATENVIEASGTVNSLITLREGESGTKEPILTQKNEPKIRGVSVVCRGAENIKTRAKIIQLVASTLNLNQNQIFVTE